MKKVFLAAGHHPTARGASFEDFNEHDEATLWCADIAARDESVMLVPTGTLKEKARWINERARLGDLAVELHFNSAVNAAGEHVGAGSVTLYYPGSDSGRRLAEAMQAQLSGVFPPDRGVVEGWYRGDKTRGVYYFLEHVRVPAVILEPEFVHRKDLIRARMKQGCDAIIDALKSELSTRENHRGST